MSSTFRSRSGGDLARQLLPGTFEHALHHLLDLAIDLSHFDARFRNDTTGAPAYSLAIWKLFCLVHNIEKLAKHGYAA